MAFRALLAIFSRVHTEELCSAFAAAGGITSLVAILVRGLPLNLPAAIPDPDPRGLEPDCLSSALALPFGLSARSRSPPRARALS